MQNKINKYMGRGQKIKIQVSTQEMQEFGQRNGWLMHLYRNFKNKQIIVPNVFTQGSKWVGYIHIKS